MNEEKDVQQQEKENQIKRKMANTTKNTTKNTLKNAAKLLVKAIRKLITFLGVKGMIILLIAVIILILFGVFIGFLKSKKSKDYTAGQYSTGESEEEIANTGMYRVLGVSNVIELVTINGTPEDGYSIAFVDDIDEKLQQVIDSDEEDDNYNALGIDTETLKEYIKAEVMTQIPNLGNGVSKSKLPDLNGVDINNESLDTDSSQVSSMDGFLMLGDSFTVGIQATNMLDECQFKCVTGVGPQYWLDNFSSLPESANGVCMLLGVNALDQTSQMKTLIDKLCKKYKDKPIYVQKVFPLGADKAGYATMSGVKSFNQEISKYCSTKENVYFIDTTDGYINDKGYLITNDSMKLHPNEYQTLVKNIKNKIVVNRVSSSSSSGSTTLEGNNEKEAIWNFLIDQDFSEAAVAGIMGNWQQESGFKSNNLENGANTKSGLSDEEFSEQVNNGTISKQEFIDGDRFDIYTNRDDVAFGYGLAQWTSNGRKEKMYDFSKDKGTGIDDLQMQLEFFMEELKESYSSLLEDDFTKIDDVSEATVTFHQVYEGSGDSAEAIRAGRIVPAEQIYEDLHGTRPSGTYSSGSSSSSKNIITVTDRKVNKGDEFQGAIKIKRVIPNKQIGEFVETTGKVVEMTFVPEGVFNAYLNQNNQNVLEVYTLNSKGELIFAKWSYSSSGGISLSKASSVNFATVLDKYMLSYNYLMIMNVHGEDVEFCKDLAKTAIDSEFVIAIQDEVTTTSTTTTYEGTDADGNTYTYTVTENDETDKPNVELTYADTWFVKVYNKKHSYSEEELGGYNEVEGTTSDNTSSSGNVTKRVVVNKYESGKTKVEK